MAEKQFACNITDVSPEKPCKVMLNKRDYGIYQIDDAYYALRDKCPHRGGSLCGGPVTGTAIPVDINIDGFRFIYGRDKQLVRCSWHGWEYDIKTGECLADTRLKARKVEVVREDDKIYLML